MDLYKKTDPDQATDSDQAPDPTFKWELRCLIPFKFLRSNLSKFVICILSLEPDLISLELEINAKFHYIFLK